MSNGDIPWSGRAVRWLFWSAPKRAVKYTVDSNMALASDLGRRWITWIMFGAYLWGFRWLVRHILPVDGLRALSAVLLLLWFWHGLNLLKWSIKTNSYAARQRALAREQHAILHELRGDFRNAISAAAGRVSGGTYTMPNLLRHHDPAAEEQQRMRRAQADESRSWLPPEQQDMPLGDQHDPVFPMPKWMRKRRPKDGGE
jgi:hypothetical protein